MVLPRNILLLGDKGEILRKADPVALGCRIAVSQPANPIPQAAGADPHSAGPREVRP